MALVGTPNFAGPTMQVLGVDGVNDNDIVIELDNVERYNEFTLMSSAGAMDVDVSLDGTNFAVAIALEDLHSLTPAVREVATTADLIFRIQGTIKAIRIRQDGVTAAADPVLYCGQLGRG